jgi:hypothetical protein
MIHFIDFVTCALVNRGRGCCDGSAAERAARAQRPRRHHDRWPTNETNENVTNMKYVNSENLGVQAQPVRKIMKIGILEFWSYEFHIMLKMISDTYFRTDVRTTYT